MAKIILIDNGHGQGNGNGSPDGTLLEWQWCRECAALVVAGLRARGIEAHLLTPEIRDVPIAERVRRANAWCAKVGAGNVAVVSIHVNASGRTRAWRTACGWLCCIDPNAGKGSVRLANLLASGAMDRGLKGDRRQGPVVRKLLGITNGTRCAAALTENMFQDNRGDCAYLLSDKGMEELVALHVEAIGRWCDG